MIEFFTEYGLFLLKSVTIVAAILAAAGGIASLAMRKQKSADKQLEITNLNQQYEEMKLTLESATLSPVAQKQKMKAAKKKAKQEAKAEKKAVKAATASEEGERKTLYVIDFHGDLRAQSVETMREEVSALLTVATESDEVLVRLESGGGTVHGYGLGASQLQRIRDRGIPLTVSVDKVAASGGYMMACVANNLIAAPFSIIGSIGVLAQIPNLHRFLKKHDVDYEMLYAGEFKRTLTLFGENTDKGREKMQQELEDMHGLFKSFVSERRPGLDIDKVATGEHWLGTKALELGLVDHLQTSDDYMLSMLEDANILKLEYTEKKNLMDKLSGMMSMKWRQQQESIQDLDKPMLV